MRFVIRVLPGARRIEVGGSFGSGTDEALVVRVAAPAVEGRANKAVIEALAEAFGVRPRSVRIVGGLKGRTKLVEVDGATMEVLQDLMGRAGSP